MDKVSALKQATEEFTSSTQTANDYMKFVGVVVSSIQQGSGLVWSQILDIFEEVVGVVPSTPEYTVVHEKQPHEDEFTNFIQSRKITNPDESR